MASLEDRVTALERTYLQVRTIVIAIAAGVLIFFGVTSLLHVPSEVRGALRDHIQDRVPEFDRRIAEEMAGLEAAAATARNTAAEIAAQLDTAVQTSSDLIAEQQQRHDALQRDQAAAFESLIGDNRDAFTALEDRHRAAIDNLAAAARTTRAHRLGVMPCDTAREFPVPVPGTTTDDWILVTAHHNLSAATSGGPTEEFDNALYGFSTTVTPHPDRTGWSVRFNVDINTGAANGYRVIAGTACYPHPSRHPRSEATIVAVPATR